MLHAGEGQSLHVDADILLAPFDHLLSSGIKPTFNGPEYRDLSTSDQVTASQDAREAVQLQVGPVYAGTDQREVPLYEVKAENGDSLVATVGGELVPGHNLVLPGSERDISGHEVQPHPEQVLHVVLVCQLSGDMTAYKVCS